MLPSCSLCFFQSEFSGVAIMAERAPTVRVDRYPFGVAVLVIERPEARNALSVGLTDRLREVIGSLAGELDLRALVVTGSTDAAFCAGADLRERQTMSAEERTNHTDRIAAIADALALFPTPVIAAINGYALAGGMELAIGCDLRVAGQNAVFGLPEVKIGIFPGAGGVVRLPRIVGASAARDLIFTGRRIAAAEAFEIGMIDRLVPTADTLETALELAGTIAANAPLAIRAVKQALWESDGLPERSAQRLVQARRRTLDDTRDYREGLAAFAERREPQFTGE